MVVDGFSVRWPNVWLALPLENMSIIALLVTLHAGCTAAKESLFNSICDGTRMSEGSRILLRPQFD